MPNKTKNGVSPVTDEDRKSHGELARRLMVAYVSWQGGIQYPTAEKSYGRGKVGDYWILLAMMVKNNMTQGMNRAHDDEEPAQN